MVLSRTQISLSEDDRRILDVAARRTGLSMSALIRDAIHSTYGAPTAADAVRTAIDTSFGVVAIEHDGEREVERLRSGRRLAELA
ncbi:ribbon-helix-helix protein, CopG family [Microbacterium luticocti]|uniref:ribbon-helix-helix protein, CopG family n=1 Tax=Microbacterium luticocti TaxID=451764 RepID=UPI000569D4BD|nr:ribbon-helix-helix protein, CopG family [Microbacterium luticocti]